MSVDQYLKDIPQERKERLLSLRSLIKASFPEIVETMDYNMPTYVLKGETLCAFASQKNYMALYIMPYDLLNHFKDELAAFNCGASCIRFKKLGTENLDLFGRILKYCASHYPESQFYGRMNASKK